MFSDETLLQKYLPYNNAGARDSDSDSDSGDDPYSSDHFRMYEFKVRRCTRSRSHDWTDCPFAHPGEKARRRDPRRHHYSGTVCPDYRRGGCSRGDSCEFAHGVFECWLHPARYRTEACKDGKNCKRKVCFFAHSPRQLRILPGNSSPELSSPPAKKKYHPHHHLKNHCCVLCAACCGSHSSSPVNSSPTSTLLGLSHPSPPMSPMSSVVSYKDALTDLMSSLEAMHFASEAAANNSPVLSPISGLSSGKRNINNSLPWVDVNSSFSDDQQQFILSPSTPNKNNNNNNNNSLSLSSENNFFNRYISTSTSTSTVSVNKYRASAGNENLGSNSDPDLGWVNELLM
ncbi:hypothetical protein TIFTF001_022966 [Ficus carica]|uniref:C3H1-type domain-containing protein n=1 Tax=Ficus carica TaxID=3494 RepID=A0AA88DC50_FICCA|nr:hypothetical protein TIFTF001_022966 [Ficus carica]